MQFVLEEDLLAVMDRGILNYKTDAVALRRVYGPSQLDASHVTFMEVWTQLHRIPPEALSMEGVLMLAGKLGTPLSEVKESKIYLN